ncbi:uroporphyrinogen decarboxylase family protein [Geosporobacter ferrireducens]|uniref:Uroporphyrinogen decarboxylase n=1 Tax=Geosporobacter ferrireducens TaxID=1424294 RepID=A0A1D8GKZ2_9FIRM|nr:uroporphyrinogen decarboxylase family protein [Geosporobacter ferrireducens]AOT71577.1 uroporphyrinogen decarboxylase [Geosporobacter ferrireducens]MTI57893.1 uroporphyrinogen decarboxylase [Geosporobacter ferrireducens]
MSEDKRVLYQERLKRYTTAMDLGKPDKVPIRLSISEFAAKYAGYTHQEIYYQMDKNVDSINKILKDFDIDACFGLPSIWWATTHDAVGARYLKFAGAELDEDTQFQYVEGEYMQPEDYDAFLANPTEWIANTFLPRLHRESAEAASYRSTVSHIKGAMGFVQQLGATGQAWADWANNYGAVPGYTGFTKAPFDTMGDTLRGLRGVMKDMARNKEKLLAAIEMLVAHNIFYGFATSAGDTQLPLFMPLHRGAFPFLNPKQWDEFYWPTLKKVIEGLWANGKRTLFFAEGNWTPYLEKIAELPEKSIVFHVDMTDMAQAKKILGGRFCISGNVPNTLLAYGKPEEVKTYVKRLIDTYAGDGGFIIDAAAVIQADAQVENMKALIEAAREYGVYE